MEEPRWSLGGFAREIKKEDEIDFEQIVIRKKKRGWQGRNWGKKEANWMHAVAFWKVLVRTICSSSYIIELNG